VIHPLASERQIPTDIRRDPAHRHLEGRL